MQKVKASMCFAALVLALASIAVPINPEYDPIVTSTGAIVPGEWNASITAGQEYADAHNVPMLAIYGTDDCSNCRLLQTACNTDEFKEWAKFKQIVMVFNSTAATMNFCRPSNSTTKPFVCVYWKKSASETVKECFTGTSAAMPSQEGATLAAQLINSCDKYIGAYPELMGLEYLAFTNSYVNARLEAEVGLTEYVDVPLVRDPFMKGRSSINLFKVFYKGALIVDKQVVWDLDATDMSVRVDIPAGALAGDELDVFFLSQEGEERGSVKIFVVGERENSTKNPFFVGERTVQTLGYGEWTMDLDVAMEKYRSEPGSHLMAVASGSLWCPDCVMTDEHVLETSQFKAWALENKVILVDIDVPNFPNTTGSACLLTRVVARTSDGYISGRGTLPANEDERFQSGAGYISRHMISDADAKAVLERNRSLVGQNTLNDGWNNPDRKNQNRTGIPNFFALDRSGALVGTFETFDAIGPSEFKGAYLKRFAELIALEDGDGSDFPNRCWQTTMDSFAGEGETSGTLSAIDLVDTFALSSIFRAAVGQEIIVTSADTSAKVTVNLIAVFNNRLAKTMATAKGRLVDGVRVSCTMTPREKYYVQVVGDAEGTLAVDSDATDTTVAYTVRGMREEIVNPDSIDWMSKTARATLPLYAADGESVAGWMELQLRKKQRLSVKVYDEGGRLFTQTGQWDDGASADGTATATLSKNGYNVVLNISSDGVVMAEVTGAKTMSSGICLLSDDYGDWSGSYVAALPLADNTAGYWCGDAFMTLSMANGKSGRASGKMKYVVYLPDGKKMSGSAGITVYDANFGIVPIVKKSGGNVFRAAVLVRRSAGSAPTRRALMAVDGVNAIWKGTDGIERKCGECGSFVVSTDSLVDASGGVGKVSFAADAARIAFSERFGVLKGVFYDGGAMAVLPESIVPEERSRDFAFKLNRKTGVFAGRTVLSFSYKEKVKAKFSGVILPGWFSDCECQEDGDTVVPMTFMPFGVGQCVFSDVVDGRRIKRSFPVSLDSN